MVCFTIENSLVLYNIMPARDGTGPRGRGRGLGRGNRPGRTGRGLGGVNECVCPECGYKESHKRGIPCTEIKCPKCGAQMTGDYCKVETK